MVTFGILVAKKFLRISQQQLRKLEYEFAVAEKYEKYFFV